MTFTGTLIEDLMATVERAEQRAQADAAESQPMLADGVMTDSQMIDSQIIEPWMASAQGDTNYEQKFLGVA
jgi:hypothetical protein